jgi:hypothetical protein
MPCLVKFISFPDHRARYLPRRELMNHKPTRVLSAKEKAGDIEVWLSGHDKHGPYYGRLLWSEIRAKPLTVAWVQPVDFVTVSNMMQRIKRQKWNEMII